MNDIRGSPGELTVIPLAELHPFKDHPFRVLDDEEMEKTTESIQQFGVISPILVRPQEDGYEIISGHRRFHAAQLIGLTDIPAIIREMDDDEAVIAMVDANLQRESILPSERAQAYKMKMEALRRQAGRPQKENVSQVGTQKRTDQIIAEAVGESRNQVQRYVRLTNLIPELLQMVDEKQIALNPAVEISYLNEEEQRDLLEAMDYAQATPSLSQAQQLKKLSRLHGCNLDTMQTLLNEEKKSDLDTVTLKNDVLRKYFPPSYTPRQMQETIIGLLEQWQRGRDRER